jgi:hypothetical protein
VPVGLPLLLFPSCVLFTYLDVGNPELCRQFLMLAQGKEKCLLCMCELVQRGSSELCVRFWGKEIQCSSCSLSSSF